MSIVNVVSYNIHKGFSPFNRRVVLHDMRERLHGLDADIVFLQEVQGAHARHASRHADYPDAPQHEFIASEQWEYHAYGMNAVYDHGHHGNAVISRHPILRSRNRDVSAHRFEQRGLLHSEVQLHGKHVHCLCVHFGLFARGRRKQTDMLIEHVLDEIPREEPLIIAGDFNDWRNQISNTLEKSLDVHDVFHLAHGRLARSFPSALPLFRLDRIYVRGFEVVSSEVHGGWRMSDHAALFTRLKML